jgi:hypothetical protein
MVGPNLGHLSQRRQFRLGGVLRRGLLVCVLAAAATACHRDTATLTDLKGLRELSDRFNADRGTVRIVLLLSPT